MGGKRCKLLLVLRWGMPRCAPLPLTALPTRVPAAGEPRLRYYDLQLGSGAEAKEGSRVVVSRAARWHYAAPFVQPCGPQAGHATPLPMQRCPRT